MTSAANYTNPDNQETRLGKYRIGLKYKAPYLYEKILDFFRFRTLSGIEIADEAAYMRTARIHNQAAGNRSEWIEGWLRVENDPKNKRLFLIISESLIPVKKEIASRVRRMFDLDCDPLEVAEGIVSLDDAVPGAVVPGTRLPGCFEPFETACRAVLGQQVSVAAANKLAARIVEKYGVPVNSGIEGLAYAWPTPQEMLEIADSTPGGLEEAFGTLGVIGSRSRTIAEIARLIVEGELDLSPNADAEAQMERLVAIKGIGPWTANYIAMRTMSHTDAFLETDVGVKHALPDLTPKQRLEAAESWRPWRSYANISLWNSLG